MQSNKAVAIIFNKPIELGILAALSSNLTTTDLFRLCPDLALNKIEVETVNDFLLDLNTTLLTVGVLDDQLEIAPKFLTSPQQ